MSCLYEFEPICEHRKRITSCRRCRKARRSTPVDTVRANRNVIAHSQDALAFFRRQAPEEPT